MVNLRCTDKLLAKLHITKPADGITFTNILGNWYANYFNASRTQYFIFINEITALSVIIPAKGLSTMIGRFTESLGLLLKTTGIPDEKINIELKEIGNVNYTRTNNRSLSGNMDYLTEAAKIWLITGPDTDLSQLNEHLADRLVGPPPYHYPKEKVRDLFHIKETCKVLQIDRINN